MLFRAAHGWTVLLTAWPVQLSLACDSTSPIQDS